MKNVARLCGICRKTTITGKPDACDKCIKELEGERSIGFVSRSPSKEDLLNRVRVYLSNLALPEKQGFVSLKELISKLRLTGVEVKALLKDLKSEVESGSKYGYRSNMYRLKRVEDDINKAVYDILNGLPIKPAVERLIG